MRLHRAARKGASVPFVRVLSLARQGDPAPPPRPTTEEITVKEIVIVADPTLVTVAINNTLDVIWPLLPAATLAGLAWV